MRGALLVCGTHSDAGKSVVAAGICRWLRRLGVRVAPFKAQNMALNSVVGPDGSEVGRAQAMQAAAAGLEPEAAMNPVLIKPSGERHSQVVVMGRPYADADARSYQDLKNELRPIVADALADLRARFDVVICEGAGSPAEVNLRDGDLTNMGLARAGGLPVLVVGDIDRGGVLASLLGTLALLKPADQDHIAGFVVNKFRGDGSILAPGLARLEELTGRATLGVLPWIEDLWMDVEDSLALDAALARAAADRDEPSEPPAGTDVLRVAVVRLPRISNFTDVDALRAEPGVAVRFVTAPGELADADLVVVPGTRATVADLDWLRRRGFAAALAERAAQGRPMLGICGGYQLFGTEIDDGVESTAGRVAGLGLLPVRTAFAAAKVLARPSGVAPAFGGAAVRGYEIHHGRVTADGGEPLLVTDAGQPEGCRSGAVHGTVWHGLLENDAFRRAFLAEVAAAAGRRWVPGTVPYAAVREARLDLLGDLVAEHLDTAALGRLITSGAPPGLPFVPPGAPPA